MTVFNEAKSIRRTLDTIAAQTATPDELVVVDAGSSDSTVALIEAFARRAPFSVVINVAPGVGISRGRNLAIGNTSHELVAVTDAGVRLRPTWLAELKATYADSSTAVVSGFFEPEAETWLGKTIGTAITPTLEEIDPGDFLPSSRSVLFEKSAWNEVGGYPEWLDYCEDLVFDLALRELGYGFSFSPNAIVAWDARDTWEGYVKQYYRYARGDGKADLWFRRHMLRYAAYVTWTFCAASGRGSLRAGGLLAFGAYLLPKVRRVLRHHGGLAATPVGRLLAVPVVVVVGDVSKMGGYPTGVWWRLHGAGNLPDE